jgi:hypothetical protein
MVLQWWVDDLLATLGVLVMIEQQAVLWSLSIYQPPTLPVFYAVILSSLTMVWYVHSSCSCPSNVTIHVLSSFCRLARGSILASVIRIMPGGPLRNVALFVSGLFVVLYGVIVAQIIWVCEMNERSNHAGYIPFFCSTSRIRLTSL